MVVTADFIDSGFAVHLGTNKRQSSGTIALSVGLMHGQCTECSECYVTYDREGRSI